MLDTPPFPPSLLPADAAKRVAIAKGELVFATGDPTRGLFLVEEGLVRLMRHGIDGDDVTLHVAGPGEMFAEASLFAERYHCDAIAERPTTLLTFAKARVLAMLETEPRSARRWIEHLSRQVQSLRAQTALLGLKTAADRVLSYLRLRAGKGVVVPIDRPWKVIASELGLTHEALYRALARLERDGVIVRDRKRFLVTLRPDRSRRSS